MDIKLLNELRLLNEMPWIEINDDKTIDLELEKHPSKAKLLSQIKSAFHEAEDKVAVLDVLLDFLPMIQKEGVTKKDILNYLVTIKVDLTKDD